MWLRSVAVGLALLCLTGAGQAASWLQYGGSADQTGYTGDPGPKTDDIAWKARLDGSRAMTGWPLIHDGWAYVLESGGPFAMRGSPNQISRFSLETGERTILTKLPQTASSWASDGSRLYVLGSESILVIEKSTGSKLADWAYPRPPLPDPGRTFCLLGTVTERTLTVYCIALHMRNEGGSERLKEFFRRPYQDLVTAADSHLVPITFVASYSLESGERLWHWYADVFAELGKPSPVEGAAEEAFWLAAYPALVVPSGMAVLGPYVVATGTHASGWRDPVERAHGESHCFFAVLDAKDGTLLRRFASTDERYRQHDSGSLSCGLAGEPRQIQDTLLFGKFQHAFLVNTRTWEYVEVRPLGDGPEETGAGPAFDGRHLYLASWTKINRYDSGFVQKGAPFAVEPGAPDAFLDTAPILTDGVLYAMAHDAHVWNSRGALYAIRTDGDRLELAWKLELPHHADSLFGFNYLHAVGDSMLVMASGDGNVIALGQTSASPVPVLELATQYPPLGAEFRLDLGTSRPGRGGAPNAFRVEWGDGAISDWQPSPVFTHVYDEKAAGPQGYVLRAQVRNDAGQTASRTLQVFPGAAPPAEGRPAWFMPALVGGLGFIVLFAVVALLLLTRRRVTLVYSLLAGRSKQRFEILRELGRGSSGAAFLARDTQLDRKVVLKQPYAAARLSPSQRAEFLAEARLAAKLHHPNVVTVFEVLPDEEPPIMVLEYGPGGSLADLLRAGPVSASRARDLTVDILQGLAAIHGAGVLHRDLKPSNIILDADGRAKVTDFGIALSSAETDAHETLAWGGQAAGTIAYMGPERLQGEPATALSDLYAAAAISFELFTGRHHVDGNDRSAQAVRTRILTAQPHVDDARIPAALRPVLLRALAPDPAKRYADAKTFLAEFSTANTGGH